MQKQKIYNRNIIDNLKTELNKFKDEKKKELTLDKILVHAKDGVAALIGLNCSAQEIAAIFDKAGVKTSANKIKQLYFTPANRNSPKPLNKVTNLVKE